MRYIYIYGDLCGSKVCYCSWLLDGCCIAFGGSVEILQYIMEKITIFLISFNSHYISFHSSVFFLFEMCRWISKKQINYSLALPVSHKHLVNIIFISVISLSLSLSLTLSLFMLWFLFVAFTISACPISVESKKKRHGLWARSSHKQNQIFVWMAVIKIAFALIFLNQFQRIKKRHKLKNERHAFISHSSFITQARYFYYYPSLSHF